jgi:hypothetical protein
MLLRMYSLWLDLHYEEEVNEITLELDRHSEFNSALLNFTDRETYDNGNFSGRRIRRG